MDFTVTKASPEDRPRIEEFIHEHFLPDMPLTIAFDLEGSPPPPRTPANTRPPEHIDNFKLLALDSQGNIIGLAINRFNPIFNPDGDSPEVKKMVEFMHWIEEHAELNRLPERTIELRVLSVRSDWRQKGVGRQLAKDSMRVARDKGFQAMRMCCVSEFTARVARSLGWREHFKLAYKDYPEASSRDVQLKPTPPHDHIYFYVTDL